MVGVDHAPRHISCGETKFSEGQTPIEERYSAHRHVHNAGDTGSLGRECCFREGRIQGVMKVKLGSGATVWLLQEQNKPGSVGTRLGRGGLKMEKASKIVCNVEGGERTRSLLILFSRTRSFSGHVGRFRPHRE